MVVTCAACTDGHRGVTWAGSHDTVAVGSDRAGFGGAACHCSGGAARVGNRRQICCARECHRLREILLGIAIGRRVVGVTSGTSQRRRVSVIVLIRGIPHMLQHSMLVHAHLRESDGHVGRRGLRRSFAAIEYVTS